ncbi:MAG TPA: type II secretion system protein [Planctomycetota bacterium]|nr:type II secretion system protein [Planctomycetota bacterium]
MSRKRGFTPIELPIVIVIVGVLAGMLLLELNRARHMAREESCANNMRQIGFVLKTYANEHDGWHPVEPTEHDPHTGLFTALNTGLIGALTRCFVLYGKTP